MKHICLVLCIALCVLLSACNPGGQKPDTYDSVYYAQYTGLSEDMTTPDGAVYRVYVPESFYAWSPAAIIMVPDGMSAADFADSDLGKSWRSAADRQEKRQSGRRYPALTHRYCPQYYRATE